MDDQPPNYRGEFLKSPHHAVLGLATLGGGFILGASFPLALVAGLTAYVLGWIYLPDMPLFRHWVDGRRSAGQSAAAQAEVARFVQQRDQLLANLSSSGRNRYLALTKVCHDIEAASVDASLTPDHPQDDPRLRKLDELMWTFLRLLSIEDSLNVFLETERREDVPALVKDAEQEVARLAADLEALKAKGTTGTALDPKQRIFVVSSSFAVSSGGQDCGLTPGDIIVRTSDQVSPNNTVNVSVLSSKPGDCPMNAVGDVEVAQLQEMHNQFQDHVDTGLKQLADGQGKGGLPPGPPPQARPSPDGVASPDSGPTVEAALQQQQQDANQALAEVQQAAGSN